MSKRCDLLEWLSEDDPNYEVPPKPCVLVPRAVAKGWAI